VFLISFVALGVYQAVLHLDIGKLVGKLCLRRYVQQTQCFFGILVHVLNSFLNLRKILKTGNRAYKSCNLQSTTFKLGKKTQKLVLLRVPAGVYLVKNCLDIRIAAV